MSMYFALLLAIILATGLLLNGITSVLALAVWRVLRSRLDSMSAIAASRFLLVLRMAPFVLSLFFVATVVVPAFLRFEPRTTLEPLSFTLLALAVLMAIVVSAGLWRCAVALLQSRRIMRQWLEHSQQNVESLDGVQVRRYRSGPQVMAVMGVWSTKIFLSSAVAQSLSSAELEAALRHELVHAQNHDILKKMFLQLAPVFLPGIDLLKPVSAHWSRMCELAADEQSVAGNSQRTLNLASALVKVVRLSQDNNLPTLSAALAPSDGSLLSQRIRRLLEISECPSNFSASSAPHLRRFLLVAAAWVVVLLAAYPQTLSFTHELMEVLVRN